jgi:hypothetical protein
MVVPAPGSQAMLRKPYTLPQTPGMIRALIAVRLEIARQCHPESMEHWRLQQSIADLERRLYAMEAPLRMKSVDESALPF